MASLMVTCECGEIFQAQRRTARYCCRACRAFYWRKRREEKS